MADPMASLHAFCYSLLSSGTLHNPDSGTRMYTAINLARRGSFEGIAPSDFLGVRFESLEFDRDRHGLWVEMFNDGQSLMLAPFLAPIVWIVDARSGALLGLIAPFYSSGPLAVVFATWLAWASYRKGENGFRIASDLGLLTAAALLVYSPQLLGWLAWRGEICWGPRTLVHFLLVIPAWLALRDGVPAWARSGVLLALSLGFAVNLMGTLYPAELDVGAQRVAPVYGEGAAPEWVNYAAWRATDFVNIITGAGVHVPIRFSALPGWDAWFVPKWWCIRLWSPPDHGIPEWAVAAATGALSLMALLCLIGLRATLSTANDVRSA